jgi:hypothetical protein
MQKFAYILEEHTTSIFSVEGLSSVRRLLYTTSIDWKSFESRKQSYFVPWPAS